MAEQGRDLDEAFTELVESVRVYERTWWLSPAGFHADFLADYPDRRLGLVSRLAADLPVRTHHLYVDEEEIWFPERCDLQDFILRDLMGPAEVAQGPKAAGDGTIVGRGTTDSDSPVYFLIGLPGSGKTRALRPIAMRHAGLVNADVLASDADEVRCRFPEYQGGLGSGVVQDETALVTYGAPHLASGRQEAVLADGRAALVDIIGDPEFLPATINLLVERGRPCYVLMTRCPVATCEERVKRRAIEDGRFVPVELIARKAGTPERALQEVRERCDLAGWGVVDTSGEESRLVDGDGSFDVRSGEGI